MTPEIPIPMDDTALIVSKPMVAILSSIATFFGLILWRLLFGKGTPTALTRHLDSAAGVSGEEEPETVHAPTYTGPNRRYVPIDIHAQCSARTAEAIRELKDDIKIGFRDFRQEMKADLTNMGSSIKTDFQQVHNRIDRIMEGGKD